MWIELSLEQDTLFVFSPLQFQVANLSASWPETRFPSTHRSTLPTLPGRDAHSHWTQQILFPPPTLLPSCTTTLPLKSTWIKAGAKHSFMENKGMLTKSLFGQVGGCPPCWVFLLEQIWKTCSICMMSMLARAVVLTVCVCVCVLMLEVYPSISCFISSLQGKTWQRSRLSVFLSISSVLPLWE